MMLRSNASKIKRSKGRTLAGWRRPSFSGSAPRPFFRPSRIPLFGVWVLGDCSFLRS